MKKISIVLCNNMHMDLDKADTLLKYIKQNVEYEVVCDYTIADIIIIMTCAFGSKKIYSVRVIADISVNCKSGANIIVTGCLVGLKKSELGMISGITLRDFDDLIKEFDTGGNELVKVLPQNKVIISEGCLHRCSYCVYPLIAGKYVSKPIDDILNEVEKLYETENTIYITGALETSDYGIDLYGKKVFSSLLNKIVKKYPKCNYVIGWFNPSGLDDDVISVIAENTNIIEIMLHIQHVDETILKNMNRSSFLEVDEKIRILKKKRKDLTISTEVIVGFPGETEVEFQNLVKYLQKGYFEDIGVASFEPVLGTKAALMENQVPLEERQRRMNYIRDNFGATCYFTDENLSESIINEYFSVYKFLLKMPRNILQDRQKYNCIAGIDTNDKLEEFKNHLYQVFEIIVNSRTEYDITKNQKLICDKYTFEARCLFYKIICQGGFKEKLLVRANEMLQV